jgi:hypothetical protein
MPTTLACNFCHLWWPNNTNYIAQATDIGYKVTSSKVQMYPLEFDPNPGGNDMAMAVVGTAIASHAISENTVTPVNDYGACFACHGATGVDTGRLTAGPGEAAMVRPFHGFGLPVANGVDFNSGGNDTPTLHLPNHYAGPYAGTEQSPKRTIAFNPGWAAFNAIVHSVSVAQGTGTGTKPWSGTSSSTYKKIHLAERNIRGKTQYNTNLSTGFSGAAVQFNEWGADLGGVGAITNFDTGANGIIGSVPTDMPMVPTSIPTSIAPTM